MKYLEDQCFLITVIFKNAEVILGYTAFNMGWCLFSSLVELAHRS